MSCNRLFSTFLFIQKYYWVNVVIKNKTLVIFILCSSFGVIFRRFVSLKTGANVCISEEQVFKVKTSAVCAKHFLHFYNEQTTQIHGWRICNYKNVPSAKQFSQAATVFKSFLVLVNQVQSKCKSLHNKDSFLSRFDKHNRI